MTARLTYQPKTLGTLSLLGTLAQNCSYCQYSTADFKKERNVLGEKNGTMLNLGRHLRGFGYLFYAISPNETSFERLEDLPKPDYITRVGESKLLLFLAF